MSSFINYLAKGVIAGVLLTALYVAAHAQGVGRSTISGFVFDETRRPLTQVMVELRSEYNSVLQRTRTQASGRYIFTGLGQGRFTIYVIPMGLNYNEQSEEVEIAGIGAMGRQLSDNVQKDVYLRPRKERSKETFKNAVVFAQEIPADAQRLYKSGADDIDRQKVDTGVKDLEGALAAFPTYFLALQKLAFVKLAQGNVAEAEPLFERALAVNADSYECLYGLSVAEVSLKKAAKAIPNLQKAIIKRPDSFESNFLLGMALRQETKYNEAEKAFKTAEKLGDETTVPDVYWNLALLYAHNMKKFSEAAKQLEQYLKVAPDAPNKDAIQKLIVEFKDKAKT